MAQSNRLAAEHSPYLLQHKDNPVDWFAWSEEAFEEAHRLNKPIFLSIGYSTCHWCHVMAHESFEDDEVARLMNRAFVSIKVDREERPDIDNIYMSVCQAMTGHGGWPLTIIMTPEAKPFFAATYIPKTSRFGRIGMLDLVPRIERAWKEQHDEILRSADSITSAVHAASSEGLPKIELHEGDLHAAYEELASRFDPENGGFGKAPKFPTPHNLLFLLRYWYRTGKADALQMVQRTLDSMRLGGIYDHLGYGFHRYSTDAFWKLPHFEKMLYDQALLIMTYVETYHITKHDSYRETARKIIDYVLRDLKDPGGSFYSAEDADSEGKEGKFYVWTEDEIREVLEPDLADVFIHVYNVLPDGNFEEEASRQQTGENVLFLMERIEESAEHLQTKPENLKNELAKARQKLFEHRLQRVRPGRDDKILTDWNGLMIAALAKAARVLEEKTYEQAAGEAADFILNRLYRPDQGLLHRYRNGEAGITANIDDYSFLVWGLVELYETTFDTRWLKTALDLTFESLDKFWDSRHGGFYFTSVGAEKLISRQKEYYDGAIPSGNSIMMFNLLRLSRMTGKQELEERAEAVASSGSSLIRNLPSAHTAFLIALDFAIGPTYEIVVAGDEGSEDTETMLRVLRSNYRPNAVVILKRADDDEIYRIAPFTEQQTALSGRATVYVCENFQCHRPETDPENLAQLLATQERERRQM